MARREAGTAQRQIDRQTWGILGLAILVILAFSATVPSLYLALARSGFLGEHLPPGGGWVLLVGLIGLSTLFCLFLVHQQRSIIRLRDRLVRDQMELVQSRGRLSELTSLFQLGNSLRMELPFETILEITVRRVTSTLHAHDATLFLYDPESRTLAAKAWFGVVPRGREADVKPGEGAVGAAARHGAPVLAVAEERDARFADFFGARPEFGSALFLPVTLGSKILAVIQVCRAARAEAFRPEHRDIGQLFAENVASVLDHGLAMERLRRSTSARAAASLAPEGASGTGEAFRDSFLGAAATELKSPLTSIVAYSEVLDQNDRKMTPSMRLEFTGRLRSEAQRMMSLVDDVLDLVRLDLGRYVLELRVANVNDVVRAGVEAVRELADAKQVALELTLGSKIENQHLDPGKIRQAVANVLRNGIRFAPPKGTIRVETALRDDAVVIEIKDPGPPVPPESSASVFELEGPEGEACARRGEGLGFGLHLAKRFVELHGGSVGAGSGPVGGATFWLRIPVGGDLSHVVGDDPFAEELAKGA